MATTTLTRAYEDLLRSPCLDHDPYSRPNLHVYRPRHLKLLGALEQHLPRERRDTIADIGCHNGAFLRLSASLGFRELIAIDYFELPAERSFLNGLPGARFLRTNFNQEGFLRDVPDASVDCVSSTEVFEHILHHPYGYLEECWRVLKPGGILLFTTPNPCTLANALRLMAGRSIQWGDQAFAKTPKITTEGLPIAVWDVHFREYAPALMRGILEELPGARVLEGGYLANAGDPTEPKLKRAAKAIVWGTGLGHARLVSATQYWVVAKST
jgi:SAM-dependent methyltransferase